MEIKALHHNDRLVFAGTACFLVKLPSENEEMQQNDNFIEEIDWEFVQRELMDNIYLEHKKLEDIQEKEREDQGFYRLFVYFKGYNEKDLLKT